jgi:Raf kinase inhibitor-like YbhB/YbcL family protein
MDRAPRTAAIMFLVTVAAACGSAGSPAASSSAAPVEPSASTFASSPSLGVPSEVPLMSVAPSSGPSSAAATGPFTLTSSAFDAGRAIPREFTCDGTNLSPPLAWRGVPTGTSALVLLVDDPDARDFVHWIVLDLPGRDGELAKGVRPSATTPQQGTNDFGKPGWGGPCPPSGTHHYRFTVTALAAPLGLDGQPGGDRVRSALSAARSSVLAVATLTGTYRRG